MKLTMDETDIILHSLQAWRELLTEHEEGHYLVPDIEALEERFERSRKQKVQWGSPTHKGRINVEAEKTFMKYYYNPCTWPDHIKSEAEMVSLLRERFTQLANN